MNGQQQITACHKVLDQSEMVVVRNKRKSPTVGGEGVMATADRWVVGE